MAGTGAGGVIMADFDAAAVSSYYDRHTRRFIRFGQGGGSLHRAVWGPGVHSRKQAFHFVDEQIMNLARGLLSSSAIPHLVDLGCGVGASLGYLAKRLPVRGTGITLSPVQARLAPERIAAANLSDRVTCIEGDYSRIPPAVESADLAYAIESFVHGSAPDVVLHAWARLVRPGGILVICDDFKRPANDAAAVHAISRFRRGWQVNTLLSRDELLKSARAAGFDHQSTIDLSDALELRRSRDRLIGMLAALAERVPLGAQSVDYWVGGNALQECLARGWIGYDFIVFRRSEGQR